jgi:hypothetical protein
MVTAVVSMVVESAGQEGTGGRGELGESAAEKVEGRLAVDR